MPTPKIPIAMRYARPADAKCLAELGRKTFTDSFGAENTPENMALYLAASFSPEIQGKELADESIVYIIAEIGQTPVGFVKLMASQPETCIHGLKPYELVRIYALKAWIGQGIGSALMKASLAEAARLGYETLWLGVWEKNLHALAFYHKWGFTEAGTHRFVLGNDIQTDFLMERPVILPD